MKKWVLLLKDYVSPKGTLDRKGFWIVFLGANLSIILFYVTFYLLFGLSVKWNLYLSYYVGVGLVVLCGGLLPLGAIVLAGATYYCIDQDFFLPYWRCSLTPFSSAIGFCASDDATIWGEAGGIV